MVGSTPELLTLVEVARIAGQKRSTVGNWKDRIEEFPAPQEMGPRGPLYDRTEIVQWLAATGRLPQPDPNNHDVRLPVEVLSDEMRAKDALVIFLMVYALRTVLSGKEWLTLVNANLHDQEKCFWESIAKYLPFAQSLLPHSALQSDRMRSFLQKVGEMSPDEAAGVSDTMVEWLELGPDTGEGELPPSIVSLVVALAGQGEVILDPAARAGQLLVAIGKASGSPSARLIGQEQDNWARGIAMLNLKIHGLESSIGAENALTHDQVPDIRADVIVSNPPWGQRLFSADQLANDARWVWGDPGSGDGNMAWVQHCLYHLADHGRAVMVLPPKVLFEQGRSAKIRQGVIKSGYLESVIALPPGLLRSTKIGVAILVFAKGRRPADGKPASTLMVNLEDQPLEEWGKWKRLPTSLVKEVIALNKRVLAGAEPESEFAAIATYNDIAENGFDISPKRYVVSPEIFVTPKQLDDALEVARRSVRQALEDGRRADQKLEALLRGRP